MIFKKAIFLITTLLVQVTVFGQKEVINLAENGDSIENLIPEGWRILSTDTGDINQDGITDLVLAIQDTDISNFELNEGLGRDTINLNPRILGIYFGNKNGGFTKKLQSNEFIILQDAPTMDEPFDGVEILTNGVIKISFHFWFSAGSWTMSEHTYNFCFQNDRFELIKYSSSEMHRGTGETVDCNVDFLTHQIHIITMTVDDNNVSTETEENKVFELETLKSIKSLGKPFEWQFHGMHL